ncbi:Rrn7p [Sugiyamaella lignohabitans]|uniref:Rrn7p n=1 Tax=Sugiyamaella lignohabitans TaxID=796027 RepID=A0A167C2X9_9ASCO|nr:Rrn7p [Sugiyamaella lignohabitans]ANB11153.1 Rrn7p [Sugiyamaella lignohabitans]
MSSIWVRGPVCGVDNCRSRLWRSVDGRKVCQYGHVKEGIEVGDDDDDFLAFGRVISRPSSRRNSSAQEKEHALIGAAAQALYFQCLQVVLRQQVKWLIEEKGVPSELEGVVRSLWTILVNQTKFGVSNMNSSRASSAAKSDASQDESEKYTTHNDEDTGNDEDEDDYDDDGDEENNYRNDSDTERERRGRRKIKTEKLPEIKFGHLVVICYLGCVTIRSPVYLYDFQKWIERLEFPFIRALAYLPLEMSQKVVGTHYRGLLSPEIPRDGKLHGLLAELGSFYIHSGVTFPPQPVEPLLFRMIKDLLLPPEIYVASEKLAEALEISLLVSISNHYYPQFETALFGVIIIAVRLCYGVGDEWTRVPKSYSTPASKTIDWDLWCDIMRKIWVEDDEFFDVNESDICYWDPEKSERYLSWVENSLLILPRFRSEYKRLLQLFPLGKYDKSGNPMSTKAFEPRQGHPRSDLAIHAGEKEIEELYRIVQSTTRNVECHYPEDVLDKIKVKGVLLSPGARFETYRQNDKLPLFMTIVCHVGSKLCGVSFDSVKRLIHDLDRKCNKLDFSAMSEQSFY